MSLFDDAVLIVLKHEGGYSCNPNDRGGATNFGISLRFFRNLHEKDVEGYFDCDVNHDGKIDFIDIKKLPREKAIKIYKKVFWDAGKFEKINFIPLAVKTFDLSVTMGVNQCVKLLQRAYNDLKPAAKIKDDGVLGNLSAQAINSIAGAAMYNGFINEAINFYTALVNKTPSNKIFLQGWLNRVNEYPELSN